MAGFDPTAGGRFCPTGDTWPSSDPPLPYDEVQEAAATWPPAPPATDPGKLLLDVREAAARMGCSRSLLYELIAAGELGFMKIGRLTRIPLSALEDLIARRMEMTRRRSGTGGAAAKPKGAYPASHRGGRKNRRRGGDR